jgi:glutamine---fructose-6-phosphate transaminase (isomerizing)
MENKYRKEIFDQPDALRRFVDHFQTRDSVYGQIFDKLNRGVFKNVILTGMGASLFSCYPLWLLLSNHGIPTAIWDTSELVSYGANAITAETVLIVVSQSGESAEIIRLVDLKKRAGLAIGITNQPDSSLSRWAELSIDIHAGVEETVSTKTYSNSLAALHLLGGLILGDNPLTQKEHLLEIADSMESYLQSSPPAIDTVVTFLEMPDHLTILGRGCSMASVQTASLILKEASKIFTSGMSAAQFRHGPIELVRPDFTAVVFGGSPLTQSLNYRLACDVLDHGGKVLWISPTSLGLDNPNFCDLLLPAVEDDLLPLLEIIPVQLLTLPLAHLRGFQAGVFQVGGKVTFSE